MGARHVDEGHDRKPEALRQLHDPHRLAVALRVGHAEVAPDVLVGVGALLLADEGDAPPVDPSPAGDERRVVAEAAVAVQLDDLVGHVAQQVERARSAEVARELDAMPHGIPGIDRLAPGLAVAFGLAVLRPSVAPRLTWATEQPVNHGRLHSRSRRRRSTGTPRSG